MADYNSLKDEELVSLSIEGDSKAIDILTLRYIPVAGHIANRYNLNTFESPDLVQEGIIGFLSAVESFNTEGNASFSTFASCCIRNRIISVVRSALSQKRIPQGMIVPLELQCDSCDSKPTPEELLISEKGAQYISEIIHSCLSEQEQKIFNLYLSGMTYDEMAEKTGISSKAVDSTLQRARKKLREKLSSYK